MRALTAKQVTDKGLTVEKSDGKLSESLELVSKRTGELQPVTGYDLGENQTFQAGVGWSYNTGAAHWHPDLDNYPYATAKQYIEGAVTGPEFGSFYRRIERAVEVTVQANPELRQAALLDAVSPRLSKEWMPVASVHPDLQAEIGVQTNQVLLSQDTLAKQLINRTGQPVTFNHYRQIQQAINTASTVIRTARNLVFYHQVENQLYRLALKRTRSGEIFLVSYHPAREGTRTTDMKKGEVLRGGE